MTSHRPSPRRRDCGLGRGPADGAAGWGGDLLTGPELGRGPADGTGAGEGTRLWRWLVLFDVAQRKGGVALALNTPAVSYIVIVTGARDWLLCMTSRAHCRNRCIQRDAIKRRSLAE